MARSVQWRRKQPDAVAERAEEALQKTLYIVHQTGPTGFVLKEEGREKKFKVFLGDVHQCSCSLYKKERELCTHILWLLLRRFRVPRDNAASFQLGLVEREINEILHGNRSQYSPEHHVQDASKTDQSNCVVRRAITGEDVCPICQEEFAAKKIPITYCKFSCGQNVHVRCMKIWAEHQKTAGGGEDSIRCPVCRGEFASLKDLCREFSVYQPHSTIPTSASSEHQQTTDRGSRRVLERLDQVMSSLRAHPVAGDSALLSGGASCEMCGELYRRGDWIRRLPCKHKFHRKCIDQWLRLGHRVCPVDGKSVIRRQPAQVGQQTAEEGKEAKRGRKMAEKKFEMDFSLTGQGIGLPPIPTGSPSPGASGTTISSARARARLGTERIPHRRKPLDPRQQTPGSSHFLPPLALASSGPHTQQQQKRRRSDTTSGTKPVPRVLKIKRGLPSSSLHLSLPVPHLEDSCQLVESGLLVTSCLKLYPTSPPPPLTTHHS